MIPETEKQSDYQHRIHRVFRYIEQHLNTDLSLETVSKEAYFSPYHFHRVFKYITGETLNTYINRQRIENSALALIHTNNSITDISLSCGFSSNSSFTRAFKKFYGVSPTAFRKEHPNKFIKIRTLASKNGQK